MNVPRRILHVCALLALRSTAFSTVRRISCRSFSLFASSRCNKLADVKQLNNEYFALRHGQSEANVAGLIASNPEIACNQYGLSDMGQQQARKAGEDVVNSFLSRGRYSGIAILSSDLLRAKETAALVKEAVLKKNISLWTDDIILEQRLRERGFGDWDGTSDSNYNEVWRDDAKDSSHTIKGVESVDDVMERATTCVLDWDSRLQNFMVIGVAHGDVLQILQTAFQNMPGTNHRNLDHLETARLRPLMLKH